MIESITIIELLIVLGGFALLITTSGKLIEIIFSKISKETIRDLNQVATREELDTGYIIGKCENILIPVFVLLNGYVALALIFTAKAIVRREDMSRNSLFFLAGTMINFTYSLLIGLLIKILISDWPEIIALLS